MTTEETTEEKLPDICFDFGLWKLEEEYERIEMSRV